MKPITEADLKILSTPLDEEQHSKMSLSELLYKRNSLNEIVERTALGELCRSVARNRGNKEQKHWVYNPVEWGRNLTIKFWPSDYHDLTVILDNKIVFLHHDYSRSSYNRIMPENPFPGVDIFSPGAWVHSIVEWTWVHSVVEWTNEDNLESNETERQSVLSRLLGTYVYTEE
jgi:hypothetical protein